MKLYVGKEDCVVYVVRPDCMLIHVYKGRPGLDICPILLFWRM